MNDEKTIRVDKETANNEFDRWATAMRLRLDRHRNENDRKDINEDRDLIVDLICNGRIIVDDDGRIVYLCEDGDPLTFYRPRAQELAQMDKKRETDTVGKMTALIAAVTRTPAKTVSGLYSDEYMDCNTIVSLFLV